MGNNGKIANDATKLVVSKGTTSLISIAVAMLLSRFRTLEEYGTYSQILTVVTLVISIFSLGLPNSTNYFLASFDNKKDRKSFLSVYYTLSTALSFIAGIILFFSVPLIEKYYDNPMISTFSYVLAVLPWANITISGISNILVVYAKTSLLMIVNITHAVLTLFAVLLVRLCGWSFYEYMILYISVESLISLGIYFIVNNLEGILKPSFDFSLIKKIFAFSIPIGLASIMGTLTVEMDKLMIGYFFDTEAVAIYANAGKELPITIVATSLTAVLMPKMVRQIKADDTRGAVKLWGYSIQLSYFVMAFFVTACIVFAPQIITILYSEKYLAGTQIFRIYSLILILRTTYFGIVLNSMGKTKFIFVCSCLSLLLNVLLNLLFYWLLGFIGPAVASFISIAVVNMLQLIVTSKKTKISFKKIFPWRFLGIVTLINIGWGGIAYLTIFFIGLGTDWIGIVFCVMIGIVFVCLYFILARKKLVSIWKNLNQQNEITKTNDKQK